MASDNILVAIKSRPFIEREEKLKPQWAIEEKNNLKYIIQVDEKGDGIGEPYAFDHIFPERCTNEDVYNTVVKPLVLSCIEGINSTIFTYGQTSSGKTHTMMGDGTALGITQLAVQDIFEHIDKNQHREYLITCSYYELYKEKINDLFDKNEKTGHDLKIREDLYGNTFVTSKQEVVTQIEHVFDLMKVGNKIKKIESTNMNEKSSRSHTIFRINIESRERDCQSTTVQISQLNLVDLAGSERIASTKAAGARLDEGININKSLSALGNVIRQLSDGEGFISYRDSKLTRVLQQALGGNAKSLIIATVTLAMVDETKSTLEFAQRAKIVKNKPIVNKVLSEQDKLKQYECMAINYKERLESEMRRIEEIQQERDQKEREITQLKDSIKNIDLFVKGISGNIKPQSRIPRRHTVGHYGSHLQPIPEVDPIPSTSTGVASENIELNLSLEEDRQSAGSSGDAHNFSDTIVEAVADQPSPTTMRVRLRHLEESYASLQEFTRLEAECKDKTLVESLKKEKEALIKDLTDYNIIIIEERKESQAIKVQYENEIESLKAELEYQKTKKYESEFALGHARSEVMMLQQMKDQENEDYKFLLEQQKHNFELQLKELRKENEDLNKELKDDDRKWWEGLQEELNFYKSENVELKESKRQLQEEHEMKVRAVEYDKMKINSAWKQEETNLLSKLYNLKDILEANHDVPNNIDERRARQKLEDEITRVNNRNIYIQRENNEFQTMVESLKQTVYHMEIKNNELLKQVENYQVEEKEHLSTIEEVTTENSQLKVVIEMNNEEKIASGNKLSEQENTILKLTETVEALKAKLAYQEAANNKLSKKLDDWKIEHESGVRQNLLLQKDVEQRDDHMKKLEEEIKILTNKNDDIQNKFDALHTENKKLENENMTLEQIVDFTNEKVGKMEEYNSELTANLTAYKEMVGDIELQHLIHEFKLNYRKLEVVCGSSEDPEVGQRASTSTSISEQTEAKRTHENEVLDKVSTLTTENVQLKDELDILRKDVAFENSLLISRIKKLQNMILEFKKRVETVHNLVSSSTYELTPGLSPREARRRKRQSLHDQRRRINFDDDVSAEGASAEGASAEGASAERVSAECASAEGASAECTSVEEEELQEYELDTILARLETEVRYLISSHGAEELRTLRQEVEDLKVKIHHCPDCKLKDIQINHLEDQQQKNVFKVVELETTVYDLQKSHEIEKEALLEQSEHMRHRLTVLEKELETRTNVTKDDAEVQCDLVKEIWLTKEMEDLRNEMNHLKTENDFLEAEVQGFIRELNDYRRYNKEQEDEIKEFKAEIIKLKSQDMKCRICEMKQRRIKELEDLQKKTTFKLVNLQTTIYDLTNTHKVEKARFEDRLQFMQRHITDLEKKFEESQNKKTATVAVECDTMDYEQMVAKYQYMKKLALLRRAEGNKLRARLGMLPDQPVD